MLIGAASAAVQHSTRCMRGTGRGDAALFGAAGAAMRRSSGAAKELHRGAVGAAMKRAPALQWSAVGIIRLQWSSAGAALERR